MSKYPNAKIRLNGKLANLDYRDVSKRDYERIVHRRGKHQWDEAIVAALYPYRHYNVTDRDRVAEYAEAYREKHGEWPAFTLPPEPPQSW